MSFGNSVLHLRIMSEKKHGQMQITKKYSQCYTVDRKSVV